MKRKEAVVEALAFLWNSNHLGDLKMTQRVLPAHVYDAVQMRALIYGGIGWGSLGNHVPRCYVGMLWDAGLCADADDIEMEQEVFGISEWDNDDAIRLIYERRGGSGVVPLEYRAPFEEWCAELGVVRGPEEASPVAASPELALACVPASVEGARA